MGHGLTTIDYPRAHLFFHPADLAAAKGEVDIYSRLERYEGIIAELSARIPEIPLTGAEKGRFAARARWTRARQGRKELE
jgi:hypothetical protein